MMGVEIKCLALMSAISCPVGSRPEGAPKLSGKLRLRLTPGSLVHRVYHQPEIAVVEEQFACNYELNPTFQSVVQERGLHITGLGERGEARIVELPGHRFFVATLYLPQFGSVANRPHALIRRYLEAVLGAANG